MMMLQKKNKNNIKHRSVMVIFDDGKLVVDFRFTLYQFNPTI